MAERTVEELANDFTSVGTNPGGISNTILAAAGGGGGTYTPPYSIDPYTSPYIQPRVVAFTINTYASLSRNGVLAKAFLNGVEIEDQTISKGRITFTINEQRLLNPCTLTIVSGDLKAQKYFLIQCRKDAQNEVSIIEYSTIPDSPQIITPSIPAPIDETRFPSFGVGSGGGGGFTGGGYEDGRGGLGRDLYVSDMNQRENLQ